MPRIISIVAALFGALTVSAPAFAQSCETYRVEARLLNMRAEPNVFGTIVDVLRYNERVCVSSNQPTGGQDWGLVVSKSQPDGAGTQKVEGWTSLRYLAKVEGSDSEPTPVADDAQPVTGPDDEGRQASTEPPETLSFTEPVPFGAFPVRGRSLEQLANSLPLFAPIDGLPETSWKKQCTSCHQWNKDRLCDQGKSYGASPESIIRIQHPYGGPYKKALSTWAASGCQ